ncbi:E3 ubiquitin-protein ligase JMJ24 [Apium graveolens]|uniref:E3 ubiquitin-protein ligase JMJ24 n=1 Tax=Apium graveolens TaxID=4045 RepID=UPI003D79B9C0
MDYARSSPGNGDDASGIPDDLRCKRSDGKQWRCTALSMPDKTVCEKHYIQAKKRAANSAMRASMKKAKRNSLGESDVYLESKSDDMDSPFLSSKHGDYSGAISGRKYNDKHEENYRSYGTPLSAMESSRSRSEKNFEDSPTLESYDGSSDSSDDTVGQICHQCRQNDREVIWCLKCDRRGYCGSCISTWYSDVTYEDIQSGCPACRGTCNCKACLRNDNLIKVKIREIPIKEKLEYIYCLLSSVLPVAKRIHREQCSEVEFERRLRGNEIDLPRMKLNADEQMCCDLCRSPIIDYHRHCMNCSYDVCLGCCQDLRDLSKVDTKVKVEDGTTGRNSDKEAMAMSEQLKPSRNRLVDRFSDWRANIDGSIPCRPKEYGGCGCSSLTLKRIFKMNWVAKLVKNVEEMVNGCKIHDTTSPEEAEHKTRLCQFAHREDEKDNYLYCPSSKDVRAEGIGDFRKHWIRGEPVIIKEVIDISSMPNWDPVVIYRGIQVTAEEKTKDVSKDVKALDCMEWSEVDIELGQFIKGYHEGRFHENGRPQMLKLKNWPSPSSLDEFLLYQRPEIINDLPLLEYIHSKWGLLNVAAKLPHYFLQNDVGPKIFISYGTSEELDRGDSVNNLRFNLRDMVYLLVHNCEVKLKGLEKTAVEPMQNDFKEPDAHKLTNDPPLTLSNDGSPKLSLGEHEKQEEQEGHLDLVKEEATDNVAVSMAEKELVSCEDLNGDTKNFSGESRPGAIWDVFRRQDVPKLLEFLKVHSKEFGRPDELTYDSVPQPLYDGVIYLKSHHKRKLKEELGVEPWSFEQHLGQAVFLPAGCPFQVRNLQSTVQLGLDFLWPESLKEATRLAEDIRGLPNDHNAKQHILEVGKISLYAASSAIKEVQKLVLDPKVGADIGFEDPNLTALVSENLDKVIKRRQVA